MLSNLLCASRVCALERHNQYKLMARDENTTKERYQFLENNGGKMFAHVKIVF